MTFVGALNMAPSYAATGKKGVALTSNLDPANIVYVSGTLKIIPAAGFGMLGCAGATLRLPESLKTPLPYSS